MNVDKEAQIQAHAQAIVALLYEETDPEILNSSHALSGNAHNNSVKAQIQQFTTNSLSHCT